MTFTDFTTQRAPFPAELLPRLRDLADRVVLGSDFPNIPYPYAHQIEALIRLDLGDDWLRRGVARQRDAVAGPRAVGWARARRVRPVRGQGSAHLSGSPRIGHRLLSA